MSIFAIEEIADDLAGNDAAVAEVAATVADESAEIQAADQAAGVEAAQIEDAVAATEELEAVGEVAVDAVEGGEGMSEESAELASIAIESILDRIKMPRTARIVPAIEQFGNSNSRLSASNFVVESITESIKKIWIAIKAAAARLWESIKSLIAGIFKSVKGLENLITGLRERARKMPAGVEPMEKKLKHATLAKTFSFKGKAGLESTEKIVANTLKMVEVAAKVGGEQQKVSAEATKLASKEITKESVKDFLETQKSSAVSILRGLEVFNTVDYALAPTAAMKSKNKKSSKVVNSLYGPFIGGVALQATTSEGTFLDTATTNVRIGFIAAPGKSAAEIDALSLADVQKVLGDANRLTLSLKDLQRVQGEYDAITKSINKVAETVMSSASKILDKTGSDSATRQGLGELRDEVRNTVAGMASFGQRGPSLVFQCAKAMADYASVSMRNLREKGSK